MRNDFLQFVFCLIALVVTGALEESLPKVLTVGFPLLLALAVGVASRRPLVTAVLFALAAGAFEDALSSLPVMTSPCFYLLVALVVWRTRLAKGVLSLAYPIYQVWIRLIVPGAADSLGVRFALAVPVAAVTAIAAIPLFSWLERKAAVDAP